MNARASLCCRAAACALAGLLLAGCGEQELYGGLSERQANEMVAVLRQQGIEADKTGKEAGSFSVTAPKDSFTRAIALLGAHGYPRDGFESLGQVFKKEGFVSSPLEERARLNYALSQEIANTLNSIDGVVVARVHLAVPDKDPLADKPPPASASVFIKHRPQVDMSGRLGQIKALVVNSIEGLPYDNVTVALFPAEPAPLRPAAATGWAGWLDLGRLLGLLGALALLAAGGWAFLRRRQRQAVAAAVLASAPMSPVSSAVASAPSAPGSLRRAA